MRIWALRQHPHLQGPVGVRDGEADWQRAAVRIDHAADRQHPAYRVGARVAFHREPGAADPAGLRRVAGRNPGDEPERSGVHDREGVVPDRDLFAKRHVPLRDHAVDGAVQLVEAAVGVFAGVPRRASPDGFEGRHRNLEVPARLFQAARRDGLGREQALGPFDLAFRERHVHAGALVRVVQADGRDQRQELPGADEVARPQRGSVHLHEPRYRGGHVDEAARRGHQLARGGERSRDFAFLGGGNREGNRPLFFHGQGDQPRARLLVGGMDVSGLLLVVMVVPGVRVHLFLAAEHLEGSGRKRVVLAFDRHRELGAPGSDGGQHRRREVHPRNVGPGDDFLPGPPGPDHLQGHPGAFDGPPLLHRGEVDLPGLLAPAVRDLVRIHGEQLEPAGRRGELPSARMGIVGLGRNVVLAPGSSAAQHTEAQQQSDDPRVDKLSVHGPSSGPLPMARSRS